MPRGSTPADVSPARLGGHACGCWQSAPARHVMGAPSRPGNVVRQPSGHSFALHVPVMAAAGNPFGDADEASAGNPFGDTESPAPGADPSGTLAADAGAGAGADDTRPAAGNPFGDAAPAEPSSGATAAPAPSYEDDGPLLEAKIGEVSAARLPFVFGAAGSPLTDAAMRGALGRRPKLFPAPHHRSSRSKASRSASWGSRRGSRAGSAAGSASTA